MRVCVRVCVGQAKEGPGCGGEDRRVGREAANIEQEKVNKKVSALVAGVARD